MPKTQQSENVKHSEVSFKAFVDLFREKAADFIDSAKSYLRRLSSAKEKLVALNAQLPAFGLQLAVLFDQFCKELANKPEWITKTATDYILFMLGLKKVSEIPQTAIANAQLFLGTVMPTVGESVWTEEHYSACNQRALSILSRISKHKTLAESGRWQDHAVMKQALEIASFRTDKYEGKLADLLASLDGEKPAVEITPENIGNVIECLRVFLIGAQAVPEETADFLKLAESLGELAADWTDKLVADKPPESESEQKPSTLPNFAQHAATIAPKAKGKGLKGVAAGVEKYWTEIGSLPVSMNELGVFLKATRSVAVAA